MYRLGESHRELFLKTDGFDKNTRIRYKLGSVSPAYSVFYCVYYSEFYIYTI